MRFLGIGSSDDASPQSTATASSSAPNFSSSTAVASGPARPIRLVYCDEKGKFQMDPEAVSVLQLVKEPVGVVSVCGRARQGKSFILNQERLRGTYSTQIFSLAVLLSSMFIYNQDFYLDLAEDNRKITPRDYLELALRPVNGGVRDVAAKNEIRESIRALFPDRDCFTLVRPLNNENELQRLDQIPLEKMRPEFKSGLDALTRFVFERTRPKQVGATVMTGPIFARITQSFLDALNNGAVPTITSSWQVLRWHFVNEVSVSSIFHLQSVEEAECERAYDSATELYVSIFDRTKPPEEAAMREAHEEAVQKAVATFNAIAVGTGSARQKYEKRFHTFLRKAFEDYKRNAFREAYLQCSNAIQNMEKELRKTCQAPSTKLDDVLKVLDRLLSKYEATTHGPEKWQKLTSFLRQSLEGPILDLVKKQIDHIVSEKSSLQLKCRSIEDKMELLSKQLEASEKYKSDYLKRYEDAINDKNKLSQDYMSRITNLQKNSSSLDERCSGLSRTLEAAKQESTEWKRKYELSLSKQKALEDQAGSEVANLKARNSAAEARLAAAQEQTMSAQEEAQEWKRKYDIAVREAKSALEKAAAVQDRSSKQTQHREDTLRAEFAGTLAEKEAELKDRASKLEYAEQCVTTLSLQLKTAESKITNYDSEVSYLKSQIKELGERLESANATAQSYEREAKILEQEKVHLEQKYRSEFDRFEEVQERCRNAEKETKRATELADTARAEAVTAQKEKSEIQRLAGERLTEIARSERRIENLERQTKDLANELDRFRAAEMDAVSKVTMLEARVGEREKEIETLLKSNNEQRASTVHVLEGLLETERIARAEANNRAEALSVQLQATQGKLDLLQQQMTTVRLNESALDGKLKTASHGKRVRVEDTMGTDSVQEMDVENRRRASKRSRSTTSPQDGGSLFKGDEDNQSQQTSSEDHTKFTILKLKQELTKHNFGAELLQLKNPNKKELVALYERCILEKP
ncbi:Guanylate-binding protein, C-terminal [Cynara cardunculus var. scolymus]|uniref:Guanylate-binding protein, C-terminal n=1 Tax=Cynara cardunculus var. scolymus TaxID=59895 RepID=A0A103XV48_CYNCS|nr:Guanylate-binding protein, C-terminal [Cynara cardunculus var. scolymus]